MFHFLYTTGIRYIPCTAYTVNWWFFLLKFTVGKIFWSPRLSARPRFTLAWTPFYPYHTRTDRPSNSGTSRLEAAAEVSRVCTCEHFAIIPRQLRRHRCRRYHRRHRGLRHSRRSPVGRRRPSAAHASIAWWIWANADVGLRLQF